MAEVRPFAGLRFSGVPLADAIAPPFDVISPAQQAELYDRSPYNVVRLELGREPDRYAEAGRCYQAWRSAGVLRRDEPSLYLYEQRFAVAGATHTRVGLVVRVKLEPWEAGVVLPHEATHSKAKEDRIQLMRAVRANVSPVFGLYEDPSGEVRALLQPVRETEPAAAATDDLGEEHRLWPVSDPGLHAAIGTLFADRKLFIADGHHRYETALAYRDERRAGQQTAGEQPSDFVMMVLVDFQDPGLVVLPTHRLMYDLSAAQLGQLGSGLGEYFEVIAAAESPSPRALQAATAQADAEVRPAFVMFGPPPNGLRVLALKREWQGKTFDPDHSPAWNQLDVSVIHGAIARALGLSAEDAARQRYFRYIQEPDLAIRAVQADEAQLVLILRSTPATAIRDVALAGDKMPQKSTYFYPKLATGVVIHPLD